MHLHQLQRVTLSLQRLRTLGIIGSSMGTPAGTAVFRDDAELVDEWRALMARYARTVSALERRLHEEHDLGVSEYEVLERLATGKSNQRMQELADAVQLSQSALSRTVGRLEAEGLVTRGMCPEDRRGIYACLTPGGRERYEVARPTQRDVLAETLIAG
jgi:DNA-binding MarR family transcriptional regulator